MRTTLSEDITKNLQSTKTFFGKNIDFTLNNVNQAASQAKDVILELLASLLKTSVKSKKMQKQVLQRLLIIPLVMLQKQLIS